MNTTELTIEFTRITNDINGNPRYVCHFLDMLTEDEAYDLNIEDGYRLAIKRANNIGGRKYNTKNYGGGLVFQSYNLYELEKHIVEQKILNHN